MTQDVVISLGVEALEVGLKVALPILVVALGIGLLISVFQAVTQIQEQTLVFVPKILAMVVVLAVAGPWMLGEMLAYTQQLYDSIPRLVGGQ